MKTIISSLFRLTAVLALLVISSSLMTSLGGITQANTHPERDESETVLKSPYPTLAGWERGYIINQMNVQSANNLLVASNWTGGYQQAYHEGVSEGWYEAAVYLANYEAHPTP